MRTLMKGILAAVVALALMATFSDMSLAGQKERIRDRDKDFDHDNRRLVKVQMFAPENGHQVGIDGKGWFVDLELEFKVPLAQSGFTLNAPGQPGFQLTGPAAHNNIPPFPGLFGVGKDERVPGLLVILSTTGANVGAPLGGHPSCRNIANLFNLTGITDLDAHSVEIWDTWIVGAPNFGVNTASTIYAAVVDDINDDGIFNDAPNVLPDADGNGVCDDKDLKAFGVASNIEKARFFINGPVDLTGVPVVP